MVVIIQLMRVSGGSQAAIILVSSRNLQAVLTRGIDLMNPELAQPPYYMTSQEIALHLATKHLPANEHYNAGLLFQENAFKLRCAVFMEMMNVAQPVLSRGARAFTRLGETCGDRRLASVS